MKKVYCVALIALLVLTLAPTVLAVTELENIVTRFTSQIQILGYAVIILALVIDGIYYVLSKGDAEKVKKAKNWLWAIIIGAIIITGAPIIAKWIQSIVSG